MTEKTTKPQKDEEPLVRSRVMDDRAGGFVPVELRPDLTVWSPAPGFERARDEVARAVNSGAGWQGKGAAELAALVDEVGRRITPNVGLVARDMGPWLDLYIRYETHGVTTEAIHAHFRRTSHPDTELLLQTIARCRGRRDLDADELLQCTQFLWNEQLIHEGFLVGDDDYWRVPISADWKRKVFDAGLSTIDGCFVVAIDESGPWMIRRASDEITDETYVLGR